MFISALIMYFFYICNVFKIKLSKTLSDKILDIYHYETEK